MKNKPSIRLFAVVAFFLVNSANSFAATYCTGGSNSGYDWFNWNGTDNNVNCGVVMKKILGAGRSLDRAYWGSYNTTQQNTAQLICRQGTKQVVGYGADVFENAANMRSQLSWSGCIVKVL